MESAVDKERANGDNAMTEAQIRCMADRFLGWNLPESFNPDDGISFQRASWEGAPRPMPRGTNLFDAGQARAMVRYMTDGMPDPVNAKLVEQEKQFKAYQQDCLAVFTARMVEIGRLKAVIQRLADAADSVGVKFFDTDTIDVAVEEMQTAAQEARAVLSGQTQPKVKGRRVMASVDSDPAKASATEFGWLIKAPGPHYLGVHQLGGWQFHWTKDHDKALRFYSQDQADATMMAVRAVMPNLFSFAYVLGDPNPVEHGWLNRAALSDQPQHQGDGR